MKKRSFVVPTKKVISQTNKCSLLCCHACTSEKRGINKNKYSPIKNVGRTCSLCKLYMTCKMLPPTDPEGTWKFSRGVVDTYPTQVLWGPAFNKKTPRMTEVKRLHHISVTTSHSRRRLLVTNPEAPKSELIELSNTLYKNLIIMIEFVEHEYEGLITPDLRTFRRFVYFKQEVSTFCSWYQCVGCTENSRVSWGGEEVSGCFNWTATHRTNLSHGRLSSSPVHFAVGDWRQKTKQINEVRTSKRIGCTAPNCGCFRTGTWSTFFSEKAVVLVFVSKYQWT